MREIYTKNFDKLNITKAFLCNSAVSHIENTEHIVIPFVFTLVV